MGKFASRHEGRDQTFFIRSFNEGLNQETSPVFLPASALTQCKNMRYIFAKSMGGQQVVALSKRQGTEQITTTPLASPVLSCTYYITGAQYIIATDTKIYYLDNSVPVEIGDIDGLPMFTEFKGKLIIHDSGVTKAWNGTTFETLNSLFQTQVIEIGDGTEVTFSGTLPNIPVKPASLTITYIDSTLKTITSAAGGALIGDTGVGTNTINYTTGEYNFTCSGAPDNATSVYAEYEKVAGAPKSKNGFVRASRMYMWGDSDNPSRMWYCGPNDEDAWDSSSSGGYLDVDPLDGYPLIGCVNYFQSIVAIMANSLHRINDFPGDATFRVVPLMENTGSVAYQTIVNDGSMISFLSAEGWVGIESTQLYGDIQKAGDLSTNFRSNAVRLSNDDCFAEYNKPDKQMWLALYDSGTIWPQIYVVNMETGGQLSQYQFQFKHSSFKFVNEEMLIGGQDGHLYRLLPQGIAYTDAGQSYTTDTLVRGVMTDFGAGFNRKHNKKIFPRMYGAQGFRATLNLYKDANFVDAISTDILTVMGGDELIFADQTTLIYNDAGPIFDEYYTERPYVIKKKFNYNEVMFELLNIEGVLGAEFYGIDFTGAIIGD